MARHAVTGALGFSGRHLTARLLDGGNEVVNLTNHPDRPDPFAGRVPAAPLDFDRPAGLATALEGVDTLFNTYWVRFPRDGLTHATAVRNSITLFEAARAAGVRRIVHVSIASPSPTSSPFRLAGQCTVEAALARSWVRSPCFGRPCCSAISRSFPIRSRGCSVARQCSGSRATVGTGFSPSMSTT